MNAVRRLSQYIILFNLILLLSSCRFEGKYKKINLNAHDFNPTYSLFNGGGTITIKGDGFKLGQKVSIGGSDCSDVKVKSETELTCTIPPHNAGNADIILSYPSGYSKTLSGFIYYNALSITSISPTSSFLLGNKVITISGDGFQPGMSINFGNSNCSSVNVISATQATCINPMINTPSLVDVILTNPSNTNITARNAFEYKSDLFEASELIAGSLSWYGSDNGIGSAARFNKPTGIIEYNGFLYVSDTSNHVIRKINKSTFEVTDFAGTKGTLGSTDGTGTAAKFKNPMGLTLIDNGGGNADLYIADNGNCIIRKININTGIVSTIAGIAGSCGTVNNASGLLSKFQAPSAITNDGTNLYVAQGSSASNTTFVIRKISVNGTQTVTSLTTSGWGSSANTTLTGTYFGGPADIMYLNNNLYVTDDYQGMNCRIKKLDLAGSSTTIFAGDVCGDLDNTGTSARFQQSSGLTYDNNYIYVADSQSNKIKRIDRSSQVVTTIAGTGSWGNKDGLGTSATLAGPVGLFISGDDLYFTSIGSENIRKLNLTTHTVTTIAGKLGE